MYMSLVELRWAVRECSGKAKRRGEDGVGIPKWLRVFVLFCSVQEAGDD